MSESKLKSDTTSGKPKIIRTQEEQEIMEQRKQLIQNINTLLERSENQEIIQNSQTTQQSNKLSPINEEQKEESKQSEKEQQMPLEKQESRQIQHSQETQSSVDNQQNEQKNIQDIQNIGIDREQATLEQRLQDELADIDHKMNSPGFLAGEQLMPSVIQTNNDAPSFRNSDDQQFMNFEFGGMVNPQLNDPFAPPFGEQSGSSSLGIFLIVILLAGGFEYYKRMQRKQEEIEGYEDKREIQNDDKDIFGRIGNMFNNFADTARNTALGVLTTMETHEDDIDQFDQIDDYNNLRDTLKRENTREPAMGRAIELESMSLETCSNSSKDDKQKKNKNKKKKQKKQRNVDNDDDDFEQV